MYTFIVLLPASTLILYNWHVNLSCSSIIVNIHVVHHYLLIWKLIVSWAGDLILYINSPNIEPISTEGSSVYASTCNQVFTGTMYAWTLCSNCLNDSDGVIMAEWLWLLIMNHSSLTNVSTNPIRDSFIQRGYLASLHYVVGSTLLTDYVERYLRCALPMKTGKYPYVILWYILPYGLYIIIILLSL